MKKLRWIVPLLLVIGGWMYFKFSTVAQVEAMELVPSDAMYILECDQAISNWNALSGHEIWHVLKKHPYFKDLTAEADFLDSLIAGNKQLFKLLGDRHLILSAHPVSETNYDFLFVLDLKNGAKHDVVFSAVKSALQQANYALKTSEHSGVQILDAEDNFGDVLTLAQVGNQLVCSYTHNLVERSIDHRDSENLLSKKQFHEVLSEIDGDGIGKLYLQYAYLDEFMAYYFDEGMDVYTDLSSILQFSALDLNLDERSWELQGYTNLDSVSDSYFHAVVRSGTGENEAATILSNRTAWYLSFNFKSFNVFAKQLESVLENQGQELESYRKNQKRLERLLGISVEDDLLSWIGDEVTVGQLRKNLVVNSSQNAVVLIKANNIKMAQERLHFISEQIKKRTPAKFKQINYRNNQIEYLDIKGFFKTFFGKAFDRIDKPYYTILGEYVVFSNSPYTLIGMIEDYEYNRCLNTTSHYKAYMSEMDEASITLYASPSNMHPVLLPMLDKEARLEVLKSKPYFESFDVVLLQLTANDEMLDTKVLLGLSQNQEDETTSEKTIPQLFKRFATEQKPNSEFVLQLIEDGMYKKYFPESKVLQIEAETKDGVLHGKYTEYYQNGEMRMEGKYKKGRKKGAWKIYDQDGTISKVKY
ncbi:MAG: DUF3352 domain-containing protein [Bacteroidia bacterium]|nr:DUF3352 domain-containing protein [Bacteroidia bacterium]